MQGEGEEEEEDEIRRFEGSSPLLLLDPPDGLNLGGLGVGAKLAVTLELSSATVRLQDVLVATVSRVLVAHKAAERNKNESGPLQPLKLKGH